MAVITKTSSSWTPFPTGIYTLKVLSVTEDVAKESKRPFLRWEFEIMDELPPEIMEKHDKHTFSQGTHIQLTEKNNLAILLDIMGFDVQVGESFDTDTAIGHVFIAKVTEIEKSNGKRDNQVTYVTIPEYEEYRRRNGL